MRIKTSKAPIILERREYKFYGYLREAPRWEPRVKRVILLYRVTSEKRENGNHRR